MLLNNKFKKLIMRLSIDFNWPPNSARVSLGAPNVNDIECEFRIGVIPRDQTNKIHWIEPGWFKGDQDDNVTFDLTRGDKVVVEKRKREDQSEHAKNIWDIDKEWPPEAVGDSFTNVPWYI